MNASSALRLGTRGSLLARTQSGHIAESLRAAHPGLNIELITITTTGDRITDRPLAESGGKGLFTKELELALLGGQIDFAVHSLKDVPVTQPLVDQTDLIIAAVPVREDARDVLVSRKAMSLRELPPGATVGTGSLRRRCQVLELRPDLRVQLLRGNIDTRLRRAETGEHDAIVLALAGLKRIGRFDAAFMFPIDAADLLPAAGQGALALQCRRDDPQTQALLSALNDPATFAAALAERAVVRALDGDCQSPIGAWAVLQGDQLTVTAALGRQGGDPPVYRATAAGPLKEWEITVESVCKSLRQTPPRM